MGVKRFSRTVLSIRAERVTSPRPTGAKEWERMKVGTITEEGAGLVYRALKLMETDISGFRKKCEERGMSHAVADCNDQLRELRGNGDDKAGLLAIFAPQLDAFAVAQAGALDGAGEPNAGGQLPLADEVAGTVTDSDVPVDGETEQGSAGNGDSADPSALETPKPKRKYTKRTPAEHAQPTGFAERLAKADATRGTASTGDKKVKVARSKTLKGGKAKR